jgi:hypothetical protein
MRHGLMHQHVADLWPDLLNGSRLALKESNGGMAITTTWPVSYIRGTPIRKPLMCIFPIVISASECRHCPLDQEHQKDGANLAAFNLKRGSPCNK